MGEGMTAASNLFTSISILRGGSPLSARAIASGIETRSGVGTIEDADTIVPEGEVFEAMRTEPEGVVNEMDALGVLGAVGRVGVNMGGAREGKVIGMR